jgi:isopentenyl-diphosphate delta-isomerase
MEYEIMMDRLILVDMNDQEVGIASKTEVHQKGLLHRAFSVFLFNGNTLLLQRRALDKYHCGGLWTNTCCSHPRPGETIKEAAVRRLHEELGINLPEAALHEVHAFVYRVPFTNGVTEFEYDHVLVGEYDGSFTGNPEEVDDVCRVDLDDLKVSMMTEPEKYTPWFIIALEDAIRGRQ